MNVLIVEDEALAIDALKRLLAENAPNLTIVGVARDGDEALELIETHRPSIVFMDIEIPGPNGLQVVERLTYLPNIIFTTAYDQFAVQAFELSAIDYLLKPISKERFVSTLKKIMSAPALGMETIHGLMNNLLAQKKYSSITVRLGDKILFIPLDEITHFFAEDKYVMLNTVDSRQYITPFTIQELPSKLPEHFFRISRSVVVNHQHILEARKDFSRRYCITLKDTKRTQVVTGDSYVDNFLSRIQQ